MNDETLVETGGVHPLHIGHLVMGLAFVGGGAGLAAGRTRRGVHPRHPAAGADAVPCWPAAGAARPAALRAAAQRVARTKDQAGRRSTGVAPAGLPCRQPVAVRGQPSRRRGTRLAPRRPGRVVGEHAVDARASERLGLRDQPGWSVPIRKRGARTGSPGAGSTRARPGPARARRRPARSVRSTRRAAPAASRPPRRRRTARSRRAPGGRHHRGVGDRRPPRWRPRGPPELLTSWAIGVSTRVLSSRRFATSKDWMITGSSASSRSRLRNAATSGSSSDRPIESK